jgi:hypothetical protein
MRKLLYATHESPPPEQSARQRAKSKDAPFRGRVVSI